MPLPETPSKSARDAVPFGVRVAAAWSGYLLLIVVGASVFLWGITKLGLVTVSFATGVMFAALLQPLVAWLMRRGVGRGMAALLSFCVGVGGLGLLLWFVVSEMFNSQDELSRQLGAASRGARGWLVNGPLAVDPADADRYTVGMGGTLSDHMGEILAQAGSYWGPFMGLVSGFVLTLFCLLFMLADDGGMFRWLVHLLPRKAHGYVDLAGAAAWRTLVVYMRSLILLAVLNAAAMFPFLWFADVPLAIPLTVVVFLGSLVPLIGVLAAGALVFAVAFVGNGLTTAIVMVVVLIIIVQLFGNVVNPIILGKFVDLHPIVILLGVTAGTILGNAFGAFVAVPLIAVINNMVKVMRSHHEDVMATGEDHADELTEAELETLAKESL